jgi:hypothetical protein
VTHPPEADPFLKTGRHEVTHPPEADPFLKNKIKTNKKIRRKQKGEQII